MKTKEIRESNIELAIEHQSRNNNNKTNNNNISMVILGRGKRL